MRFLSSVAVFFLLASCSENGPEIERHLAFPDRPEDTPFYNSSSITQANFEAVSNLDRACEITGIDFAMAMLDQLPENTTIEEYAGGLFEKWRVGGKTGGEGVLIVLTEKEHSVKIEVSYGLEDVFPDAFCGAYQETIRTYFAGQYFGDVVCRLILDMVDRQQGLEVDPTLLVSNSTPQILLDENFLSGGAGAVDSRYFYDKSRKLNAILDVDEAVVASYSAADNPEETVERYLTSMEAGVNYPFLGILTQGTHFMRMEYPKTQFFLRKTAKEYREAVPMKIFRQGDLAVARFADASVIPILLRRTPDGDWLIDVTKSWAYVEGSGDLKTIYPLYKNHAWMFAFRDYGYESSHINLPELLPFPENLEERIAKLEKEIEAEPENASRYFDLASLLYFECYWIRAAIDLTERGLELDPENVPARWFAIRLRYRFPIVEGIPQHFDALLGLTPDERDVWTGYHHFCKTFSKDQDKVAELEAAYRERTGKKL